MDSHSVALLVNAIHLLRSSAGDDPRFSSFSAIKSNCHDFVSKVHETFDHIQMVSITEIMRIESAIKASSSDKHRKEQLLYQRLQWRRVSDAIAWLLVEEKRHVIKRMCSFQNQHSLAECNPNSAIGFIREFNQDKLRFALWTDTTNCIDAGDMLLRDVRRSGVALAELKEGEVNRKASTALVCEHAREFFLAEYGAKGQKQLDRIAQQEKTLDAVINLINTDKGIDPFSNQYVTLHDVTTPDDDYGEILSQVINAAKLTGISVTNVDSCLWIAAVTQSTIKMSDITSAIENSALVGPNSEHSKNWLRESYGKTVPYPIHNICESFYYPIAYPLYLANIPTEHLVEIVLGKVRVYMYFDWASFGRLADSLGIQFKWSTKKVGRRMKAQPKSLRPLVLGGCVPIIVVGEVEIMLGETQMVRVLFDLIRPEIMLRQKNEFKADNI
ncbi:MULTISPECIES: hypothetical protein [Methylobacter]